MNSISRNSKRLNLFGWAKLIGILSLSLAVGAAFPADWTERFGQANDLYRQGRYREAVAAYEGLVSEGAVSAALYYNLGNSYFKQGQIGKTVLSYERAIRLAPKDKEILGNLTYAREFVQDKVGGPEPSAWIRRLLSLYELLTLNMALVFSSVFYGFLSLVICAMIVRPPSRRALRKWLIFFLFLLVLGLCLVGTKLFSERYSQAVIIAREVEVRYGPSLQETKAFLLHEGTQCAIREVSGEWALIWLPNDRGGWVPRESLEQI